MSTNEGEVLDRRAVMEKAFDSLAEEGGKSDGHSNKGVPDESGAAATGATAGEPVVKPKSDDAATEPEKPVVKSGTREVKFTAKDSKGATKETPKEGVKADGSQGEPVKSERKAPVSWKPEERERWGALPPEVQDTILRRENEVNKALNDSAAARRFGGEFHRVIQPYEHLIRASGVTPLQAVQNLVQTAAALQTGTPAQKAGLIANLIGSYGVDLVMLDHILAGKQPPKGSEGQEQLQRMIDERLKPVNELLSTIKGSRQASEQRVAQEAQQSAEEFANDPANEFFNDLREDIADLLEVAANRGREMTIKQAYDLAASQHPEISKVLKQREEAAAAQKNARELERSRRAATSQPAGTPAGIGGSAARPGNRREAISQAWDDLSGR